MTTSSNGIIFRVTGPLWAEFTGHRSILSQSPVARSFDVFFYLRLKTVEQTIETPVIWDPNALIMASLNRLHNSWEVLYLCIYIRETTVVMPNLLYMI